MISVARLGQLRGTPLWSGLRRLHRRVAPPTCALIHSGVERIGHQRLPRDLALKHTYDYRVLWLDPRLLDRSLRVGEWARVDPAARHPRLTRLRRWLILGGGWKHLQQHPSRNVHGRFVVGGDWDLRFKPFAIRPTITDLFVEGLEPAETVEYRKMRDWVETGEFAWTRGCRTPEDVDRYFDELIRLYDAIRTDGYRTQADLGNDAADEIRVCIDRDGRGCVFGGGTHRLSIALLLELDRVPVVVKRVHAQWVDACRTRYGTDDIREAIDRGIEALQREVAGARTPTSGGSST